MVNAFKAFTADMEKHIQTILAALVLAAILWVTNSISELKTSVSTLNATKEAEKENIADLKRKIDTIYDKYSEDSSINRNQDKRLDELEAQVRRLSYRRF
jgi:phage shock protein A